MQVSWNPSSALADIFIIGLSDYKPLRRVLPGVWPLDYSSAPPPPLEYKLSSPCFSPQFLNAVKLAAVVAAQLTNALTAPFIFLMNLLSGCESLWISPFRSVPKLERAPGGLPMGNDVWTSGIIGFCPLVGRISGTFLFPSGWEDLVVGVILAVIGYFTVLGIDTKAHMQIIRAKKQVERLKRLKQKNAPVYEKID